MSQSQTTELFIQTPHPALGDTQALLALFERWVARGWLRDLDRALVRFLDAEADNAPPLLLLGAALASHQLGHGHVCLDLAATLAAPDFALSLPPEGDDVADPPALPSELLATLTLPDWQAALAHPTLIGEGAGNSPLVRRDAEHTTRLYLRRYWQYEQTLRDEIDHRLAPDADAEETLDADVTRQALETLFPTTEVSTTGEPDWQKAACALAARRRFAVITGGPGTGKTTTVVRLLALLQTLQLAHTPERALRMRLAAPTGKAAARLNESIANQVDGLPVAESLKADIPVEVTTLHRLLGARPDTRHFRHHADNPLSLDVLVIDEASMVDIEMMTAVLRALPAGARLLLLGDKDQLASVEAGSILGDLCRRAEAGHYLPATAQWLEETTGQPLPAAYIDPDGQPLDQAIAMLRKSYRFDAASGIGQLAHAVNRSPESLSQEPSSQTQVRNVLAHGYADLRHLVLDGEHDRALTKLVLDGYRHYLTVMAEKRPDSALDFADHGETYGGWASAVLDAYGHFQLLCAVRKGPWGVEGLNRQIAQALRQAKLINAADAALEHGWYAGRPVLVTQNDYGLKLMNGDIGITLAVPEAGGTRLRVAFPSGDPQRPIRWVLPSRLHAVDTVFAMTVHKSQGSEFRHTALLLPSSISPVLTRELVYTGITRARHWLTLIEARRGILDSAVARQVVRVSGLSGSS
ncbi:exodeoxyribonuclease V subunit alpha [Vreelandella subglaciescola]|uniref:RecBCD enzyme subunit RecD n=1 Tax=Vreelandella subglaciescola TaxID=29571 RepID=A0A1M7FQN0_9GAMM|nr:exodeoxyribonuclease V subunit alpha [Halomonas subglaciescola]SHM05977.1 DNA helicase/exodeoxyribonuclease V, alpha subunit [Halomonas subglaciescola]